MARLDFEPQTFPCDPTLYIPLTTEHTTFLSRKVGLQVKAHGITTGTTYDALGTIADGGLATATLVKGISGIRGGKILVMGMTGYHGQDAADTRTINYPFPSVSDLVGKNLLIHDEIDDRGISRETATAHALTLGAEVVGYSSLLRKEKSRKRLSQRSAADRYRFPQFTGLDIASEWVFFPDRPAEIIEAVVPKWTELADFSVIERWFHLAYPDGETRDILMDELNNYRRATLELTTTR